MYVINGIPEFRKMGTGIPIFDLNGFRVFRFDFPPESSGIPNSEAEFRIPVVPGNGISKRNSQPRAQRRRRDDSATTRRDNATTDGGATMRRNDAAR
jgi:hypothetical protein